jgi:hypothetical protein
MLGEIFNTLASRRKSAVPDQITPPPETPAQSSETPPH